MAEVQAGDVAGETCEGKWEERLFVCVFGIRLYIDGIEGACIISYVVTVLSTSNFI